MTTPRVTVPVAELERVRDLLMERIHGSPARSPAHNARLEIEAMLSAAPAPEGGAVSRLSKFDAATAREWAGKINTLPPQVQSAILSALATHEEAPANHTHPCYNEHQPGCDCVIPEQSAAPMPSYLERLSAPAEAGALVSQIDALLAIPEANLSSRIPYLARELLERSAKHLRAQPPAREDGDYDLGKRDGYEQAVQDIDLLTGGDGEYVFATDGGGCPDAEAMKTRIVERFQAREGAQPVAWRGRISETSSVWDYRSFDMTGEIWSVVQPLYTHPAPDALRVAVEALVEAREDLFVKADKDEIPEQWASVQKIDQALAALQAEQKGGA